MIFRTLLSFSCFSRKFIVHINENVSFHHVAFLNLISYENLHVDGLKPTFVLFILKKIKIYLNIFVSVKTIRYYKTCNLLFHTLLSSATFLRFTKQHLPLTCTKKMDGSTITAITFPQFLTDKERYNPLDYFRMGIIEELRIFFFGVEDLLLIKNYV